MARPNLLGMSLPLSETNTERAALQNNQVKSLSCSILCDFAHPGKTFLQALLSLPLQVKITLPQPGTFLLKIGNLSV